MKHKRKGRLVINQRITDGQVSESDNVSAYWQHAQGGKRGTAGEIVESNNANPDNLTDTDENKLWGQGTQPELAGRIVEEFADEHGNFPVLSEQENLVLRLFITTGDMNEVKRITKLSRSSINTYMARIRSKMLRLIKSRDF